MLPSSSSSSRYLRKFSFYRLSPAALTRCAIFSILLNIFLISFILYSRFNPNLPIQSCFSSNISFSNPSEFPPSTGDIISLSSHEISWNYCPIRFSDSSLKGIDFCSDSPTVEQKFQFSFYGRHVVRGERNFPKFLDCAHLPPFDYKFPSKMTEIPAPQNSSVHWPNLRVKKLDDLIIFNSASPKNLFHFDAPSYDRDALKDINFASNFIPFKSKIRLALDIGAGGGSIGLLLKRRFDIQTLSIIFPDWIYCEYLGERGGLCVLVDVMEPMPFAQFSFDLIHSSWVYHGQQPEELLEMFTEIHRILRPGGYLWLGGGFSNRQISFLRELLEEKFGFHPLHQSINKKPQSITDKISFGPNLPYDADWSVIYVKPIRAVQRGDCPSEKI